MTETLGTDGLASTATNQVAAAPWQRSSLSLATPLSYAVIAAIVAILLASVLRGNHGTFTYTLDDPYIHLALSDQIRHGNYGLYPGTHAAPSSSILFPVLLAAASGTRLHPYFPLLINFVCLFVTVEIVRRYLLHVRLGNDRFAVLAQAAALVLIALSFNLVGVVFTGLEHSLHIALVAATVYGATLLVDRRRMPPWLPLVLVLSPLVRYEGLSLSLGTLILLALCGRPRTALAIFGVIAALLGGFSIYLRHLGLSALPSSIMVKSVVAAGGVEGTAHQFLGGIHKTLDTMIGHPIGLLLLLVGVFAAARFAQDLVRPSFAWTSNGLMSLPLVFIIAGQAAAGRFGYLERYEDYALMGAFLISLYLVRDPIRSIISPAHLNKSSSRSRLITTTAVFVALLMVGARYLNSTALVPAAANNVFQQQLQMHRFVDGFYRGPVAVNDLGLVSYGNPYPVLDLGGLGSETARLMIVHHATADAYRALVAANGVHFVMIYPEWFPGAIPKDWIRVGTLSLPPPRISAGGDEVQFYATDPGTASRVNQELLAFRPSLPAGDKLTVY